MHIPVLLKEVLTALDIQPDDTVLDGTINGGGHSEAICKILGTEGKLIGLDQDADALQRAKERLKNCSCKLFLKQKNFRNLDEALNECAGGATDKILLDLGLSSAQLDTSGRGFTFQKDEPLLMTFANTPKEGALTAATIVNSWPEEEIARILYEYGDERYGRRIARAIVQARRMKRITTSGALTRVIEEAAPRQRGKGKIHPATKTFQALRIAVNDEYGALQEGLEKGFSCLRASGRMAVISFHSGEDRIVKNFFREMKMQHKAEILTKKPIRPTTEEIEHNLRSRSARLRGLMKADEIEEIFSHAA